MRHGTPNNGSSRRRRSGGGSANNGGARRGGNQRMQVFDSNGPDVRIRGTAHQVAEKYMTLAKDATSAGDIVLAESYLQHAEHYTRIIGAWDVQSDTASSDNAPEEVASEKKAPRERKNEMSDDLSLPASILGGDPDVVSKRTADASAG